MKLKMKLLLVNQYISNRQNEWSFYRILSTGFKFKTNNVESIIATLQGKKK